jgi:hypothetical protein
MSTSSVKATTNGWRMITTKMIYTKPYDLEAIQAGDLARLAVLRPDLAKDIAIEQERRFQINKEKYPELATRDWQ